MGGQGATPQNPIAITFEPHVLAKPIWHVGASIVDLALVWFRGMDVAEFRGQKAKHFKTSIAITFERHVLAKPYLQICANIEEL